MLGDLAETAARATLVYALLLFVIRVLGKREIGNFTAFDLLVALMLGEIADEIIYGDVSILTGVVTVVTIAAWDLLNSWAGYKSSFIERLTGSSPRVLVKDGRVIEEALARERVSRDELHSLLREQGLDESDIVEVKAATLEPSGKLSVIRHEWAKPLQKSDLKK